MRNFKDLKIWQNGMQVARNTYTLSKELPDNEKYGLSSQIKRASISIPSNIAEGCSRNSKKDFVRFLEFALGSSYELETQLLIINDMNIISNELIVKLIHPLIELQKMLTAYINKMKESY